MLDKLRTINTDRLDTDEAIALVAFGRHTAQTYSDYQVPAPDWLKDGIDTLDREIRSRRADMLKARQKELLSKKSALKSREEQREDIDAELEKVNAALGSTSAP